MLIDLSKPDTLPQEIKNSIISFIKSLPIDTIENIKKQEIHYKSDIPCAVKQILTSSQARSMCESIRNYLEPNYLLCFHATRILDIDEIYKKELFTNSVERYVSLFVQTLHNLDFTEEVISTAAKLVKAEYERKYNGRSPQLCYFTPLSSISSDSNTSYNQFCQNVCGELARWALEEKMPAVLQRLSEAGKPVVVEFSLSYYQIPNFYQDMLINNIIEYYFGLFICNKKYPIKYSGCTYNDVPSSQIIKVHQIF